ncbi:CapA family protein [Patescibacteria group bacterium]|nr:CapA family protein [Patescibacteria group bacterium]
MKHYAKYIVACLIILAIIALGYAFVVRGERKDSLVKDMANLEKSADQSELPETIVQEEVKDPVNTTLVAGGDIMLSRHVGTKIRAAGDNAHSFKNIASIFSDADIAFANFEAPFYDQGPPVTKGMVFKAEPETIEGLELAGFDMLSLANNHFGNQGRKGMEYTYQHLSDNNINYCGAGMNSSEAHAPAMIERNDLKFAFLCYNGIPPESYAADADTPGLAWAQTTTEQVTADVKAAKEVADVVIVSMHHGTEYVVDPVWEQKAIAHAAIDAGAETVIGHHPHVVQKVEKYNDKLIVYSLGNLVFDQMWSQETREGAIGTYSFTDDHLDSIEFQVVIIEDYNQPRLASETEAAVVLKRMGVEDKILE